MSNFSGERSFSKMGLIKSKLTNKRLASVGLLSLENDLLNEVSFNDIANQFATAKSCKRL